MSAKIEMPDVQDWINKYQSGMSLKQLAEQTGISRNAIRRQFMEQGVLIRGRSEAERVKWQAIKQAPDRVAAGSLAGRPDSSRRGERGRR